MKFRGIPFEISRIKNIKVDGYRANRNKRPSFIKNIKLKFIMAALKKLTIIDQIMENIDGEIQCDTI